MPDGRITAPPHHPRWRRHWKSRHQHGRPSRRGHRAEPRPYQVGEFVGAYLTTTVAFVASTGLLAAAGEALALPAIAVLYLGCGVALSRFLHYRVRWYSRLVSGAAYPLTLWSGAISAICACSARLGSRGSLP
jgi:hypothetical protein